MRIVDLTYSIHEGMTTFPVPWHPYVEVSILGRYHVEGRQTRKLVLGTHTGTHIDAPAHFIPDGVTVENIPPEVLVGPAVVLDLSDTAPFERIERGRLELALRDKIPERLVLQFDWSDRWGKMNYYTDHPYLSIEAAEWLAVGGVKLLAMDTPMPDNPENGRGSRLDSPVHKILLGADVILVEYLTNLRELRQVEVELIVAPLKVLGGDGAPARVFAVERY